MGYLPWSHLTKYGLCPFTSLEERYHMIMMKHHIHSILFYNNGFMDEQVWQSR